MVPGVNGNSRNGALRRSERPASAWLITVLRHIARSLDARAGAVTGMPHGR